MFETTTLYGIPNCDQVKKARVWLIDNNIDYFFHDFKKAGLSYSIVHVWEQVVPISTLLNRKSLTWRTLSDTQKASASERSAAIELMIQYPTLVKRPILHRGALVLAGFDPAAYHAAIGEQLG
jgi:arsenate reductase